MELKWDSNNEPCTLLASPPPQSLHFGEALAGLGWGKSSAPHPYTFPSGSLSFKIICSDENFWNVKSSLVIVNQIYPRLNVRFEKHLLSSQLANISLCSGLTWPGKALLLLKIKGCLLLTIARARTSPNGFFRLNKIPLNDQTLLGNYLSLFDCCNLTFTVSSLLSYYYTLSECCNLTIAQTSSTIFNCNLIHLGFEEFCSLPLTPLLLPFLAHFSLRPQNLKEFQVCRAFQLKK